MSRPPMSEEMPSAIMNIQKLLGYLALHNHARGVDGGVESVDIKNFHKG